MRSRRYIAVFGSIMSGLGKGILTASICKLLQSAGYKVVPLKFDGYLNVDCGTMNPFRHGEVFVLDDGSEVDMDFGTYERFLNISLNKFSSITGGKIFQHIIRKEREGRFLGRDVQIVPHLTDEAKDWIRRLGDEADADVVVIEVGGTVGDIENSYFIEALRQLSSEEPHFFSIQLTHVPSISGGEQKTKPTQHASRLLQSLGIIPDAVVCREDEPLSDDARRKIAMFANIRPEMVFEDPFIPSVYMLPEVLRAQGLHTAICEKLSLSNGSPNLSRWNALVNNAVNPSCGEVKVGIIGKYTTVSDAYASVGEAVKHACTHFNILPKIIYIESTQIEEQGCGELEALDAVIIPGGFGGRGIEGKIDAIRHARMNGIPFLGLCLGMQLMVVEYARNVAGLEGAHSSEIDPQSPHPVVDILPSQMGLKEKGATMRLGKCKTLLSEGTLARKYYNSESCFERHRHRYEINPIYMEQLSKSGLIVSGKSADNDVVEIVEWPNGLGLGTQAHPELKSRLEAPSPPFIFLIEKAIEKRNGKQANK